MKNNQSCSITKLVTDLSGAIGTHRLIDKEYQPWVILQEDL
jgi:hypothetical protein